MADSDTSALTEKTALDGEDLLYVSDYNGGGARLDKKGQLGNILKDYFTSADETAAAVTVVDRRYPIGHINRYGTNTTPGTTDMSTAANAAVDVASQQGGGTVLFGPEIYKLTAAAIAMKDGVSYVGEGRDATRLRHTGGAGPGLFTIGQNITDVAVRDMRLDSFGDNSAFTVSGNFAVNNCQFVRLYVQVLNVGRGVWDGYTNITNASGGYYDNVWKDCNVERGSMTAAVTARMFDHKSFGSCARNLWENMRFTDTSDTYAQNYWLRITDDSDPATTYAYSNTIRDINCEQTNGGLIEAYNCFDLNIKRVHFFDMNTVDNHLVLLDQSSVPTTPALGTTMATLEKVLRSSGTLNTGIHDVVVGTHAATDIKLVVQQCGHISSGAEIDYNGKNAHELACNYTTRDNTTNVTVL